MNFVEFPQGQIPPKEVSLMTGLSGQQVRDLCKRGILKSERIYAPGLQPLWAIYQNLLPDFIFMNIPREQQNIINIQKRINKQKETFRRLTGRDYDLVRKEFQ